MRAAVPEKIRKVIDDIDTRGNVPLTRLTVLKKWFERPNRLPVFGLWVARQAALLRRLLAQQEGQVFSSPQSPFS